MVGGYVHLCKQKDNASIVTRKAASKKVEKITVSMVRVDKWAPPAGEGDDPSSVKHYRNYLFTEIKSFFSVPKQILKVEGVSSMKRQSMRRSMRTLVIEGRV